MKIAFLLKITFQTRLLSALKHTRVPIPPGWNNYCLCVNSKIKNHIIMTLFNWIAISVVAAPVFFIIKTSVTMIRHKRLS